MSPAFARRLCRQTLEEQNILFEGKWSGGNERINIFNDMCHGSGLKRVLLKAGPGRVAKRVSSVHAPHNDM